MYDEGVIGIASAGKDTEGSQFFITHSPQPHLDGRYTIIGRVLHGMAVVRALQRDDRIYDLKVVR
jgi:peptidylprolyl isomerase